jgi:hypothetical protein
MAGLRRGRPGRGPFDAEEARAGPMRAGDPGGDFAERGIALAIVVEAVFEHDDGVHMPSPFAHEPSARFTAPTGATPEPLPVIGSCTAPPTAPVSVHPSQRQTEPGQQERTVPGQLFGATSRKSRIEWRVHSACGR